MWVFRVWELSSFPALNPKPSALTQVVRTGPGLRIQRMESIVSIVDELA